ncbi:CST complex subunit CTC1 isoform X2 [Brienomyrus brachyistius]|uniref:CST complex subunit CTC1 isoform X2 n=1 Tax=Brienomyrus brachyistius TaxID=42636 RepID=UPI0020B1DF5F|nr:CST complex subunit CTC1 isoform X2 [Brienomyrus brachyistius]
MDSFLKQFRDRNQAELRWLGELYQCAEASACPRANCAAAPSAGQLALSAVRGLQELLDPQSPVMPLSYSFVSVSELVTKQNIPCCSRLTWSTHQYREWAREAEQRLPNHKALPRANLLLIGYLTDRKCAEPSATNGSDGTWRVRDQSFSVCCKAVSAQPNWLQQFMLFPSWNYIPQNASAQNQQTRGFLELTAPPVPLTLDIASVAPERSCSEIITVADVIKVLQQRRRKGGVRLHVHGVVSAVCPLLDIAGKSFFCFCLKDGESSVPVLVLDVDHLCWQQCLRVGEGVCVSELRVCALRTLGGYKVLCVTPQSHLSTAQAYPDVTESGKEVSEGKVMEVKTESGMEVKRDVKRWRVTNPDSGENCVPPTARTKISKMISYKGVLTKVLDAESGLFELDGQVGLCLAYQPSLRMASSLRPGVQIEIHNVHFLYRASSICPDVLLCVCLRSSLRVTNFSGLQPGGASHPNAEAPALRILLEKNLGISEYLWLCHCMKTLKERQEGPNHRRDIYREMLLEPHCCPLLEYTVGSPHQELLSVKDLLLTMERECWHSLSLASLLPPSGPYLMRTQLNPLLSWSFHSLPAWSTPKPPVLVGVLESQGKGVCVRLADQTGAVDCVAVGSEDGQSHCTASNTAWLGCLVSIQRFTMVVERFLKTDFPSWRHLDDECHVTHRHCRVYIQFCVSDLQILSPSASMAALLSTQQEQKAGDGGPKEKGAAEDGRVSRMEVTMAQKAVGGGGHRNRDRDSEQARHEGLQGLAVTVGNSCGVGPTDAAGGSELSADDKSPRPKIPRLAEERDGAEYGGRSSGAEGGASEPGAVRGRLQSDGCVSVVFRVESKQGLTFQNVYTSSVASGRSLCFHVTVMMFGEPRLWAENPRVHPLEASETMGVEPREVDLQFVEKSVCWFPLLQVDGVYRLVAPHTQDPGVLCVPSAPSKGRAVLHSTPYLLVQPQWRLYTLPPSLRPAPLPMVTRAKELVVMSVSQVLYSSSASALVSFQGLITSRITLEENEKVPCFPEEYSETGADVESSLNVKLTVGDLAIPGQIIHVYLKLSGRPYIPGLVPGARVLLQYFQRSVSRTDSVYCRSVPISCVTVTALPPTDCGTLPVNLPVPAVLLGEWALVGARRCAVGRVRAYVTCVLYLQMQWVCSLCGNIFKQDRCVQKYPPCTSTIGVFQAEAKVAVDDGSGEAQVWISSQMVSGLLGLGVAEWEGIQRLVKVRGHVRVYSQGRNMVSIADAEDPLVEYLSSLCVSTVVCRPPQPDMPAEEAIPMYCRAET